MQSIRQYHRFGRHVTAQYERDKAKAKATATGEQKSESTITSPSSSTSITPQIAFTTSNDDDNDDVRDPEKAEQAPAQGTPLSAPTSADQAFESHRTGSHGMEQASIVATHDSMGTTLGTALTGIDVRDRTIKEGSAAATAGKEAKDQKVFVVGYEGERDVLNPHNWSYGTRIWATVNIAFIGWIVGFASSVDSAALEQATRDFGVSEVTESLATGLFLVGFGVGMCAQWRFGFVWRE